MRRLFFSTMKMVFFSTLVIIEFSDLIKSLLTSTVLFTQIKKCSIRLYKNVIY